MTPAGRHPREGAYTRFLLPSSAATQMGRAMRSLGRPAAAFASNETLKSEDMERSVMKGQGLGVPDQVVVRSVGIDLAKDIELCLPHGKVQVPFSKQGLSCRWQAPIR